MSWFDVDKEGLAKLVERRGKGVVLLELLQNAWDAPGAKTVNASLASIARGTAELVVWDDDPEGFLDLSEAWTLFAESRKKGDPELRGRFNLGEKLVLALCQEAEIRTVSGSVQFRNDGTRTASDLDRTRGGSVVRAIVRMTKPEVTAAVAAARCCLPPETMTTVVNGETLEARRPLHRQVVEGLQTEVAGAEGLLRTVHRAANVRWFRPAEGETPMLYELGIPVVESGVPFHVDVCQKVPLTFERDNVRPAYLRRIRELTLEHMHAHVSGEETRAPWVTEALPRAGEKAVRHVVRERFGERAVIADPSDREGENIAKAEGYVVVPGGSFTKPAWEAIKESGALKPAGQVTPSRPNATVPEVPFQNPTEAMRRLYAWALRVAVLVDLPVSLHVRFIDNPTVSTLASYGDGTLTFNVGTLGHGFFEDPARREERIALVIHELAHEWGHHLESGYHLALERIGARLVEKALTDPRFFEQV